MASAYQFKNNLRWTDPRILSETIADQTPSLRSRALHELRKSVQKSNTAADYNSTVGAGTPSPSSTSSKPPPASIRRRPLSAKLTSRSSSAASTVTSSHNSSLDNNIKQPQRHHHQTTGAPKSSTTRRNEQNLATVTWEKAFFDEGEQFRRLATQIGLPLLEIEAYERHFIQNEQHGAPQISSSSSSCAIAQLPALQYLNSLLTTIRDLVHDTMDNIATREQLILTAFKTCGAPGVKGVKCTLESHEKTCKLMREIDLYSIKVMDLITLWREQLSGPLPFFHEGENYLMRMVAQHQPGTPLTMLGSHLRATSRHMPFFYASPFDSINFLSTAGATTVVPTGVGGGVANRWQRETAQKWREVCVPEPERQEAYITEQFDNSRMGLLIPTVRWRRTVLAGRAPPTSIPIYNKQPKAKLMQCFASALTMLARVRPKTNVGSISQFAQLATFSTKALHLSYFRKWIEFVSVKRDRRSMADSYYDILEKRHLHLRFNTLLLNAHRAREGRKRWQPMLKKANLSLLRVYVGRWFMQDRILRLSKSVRRALFIKFYRAFHLKVIYHRLANLRMLEAGDAEHSNAFPVTHDALKFVSLVGGATATPYLGQVLKAHQRGVPMRNVLFAEAMQRVGIISEWYRVYFIDFLLPTVDSQHHSDIMSEAEARCPRSGIAAADVESAVMALEESLDSMRVTAGAEVIQSAARTKKSNRSSLAASASTTPRDRQEQAEVSHAEAQHQPGGVDEQPFADNVSGGDEKTANNDAQEQETVQEPPVGISGATDVEEE